jgi:hypothetical protein
MNATSALPGRSAKGKNGADAYLAAGYALARDAASRNAYRLRSRQDIRERIDELAGKTRGRIAVEQVVEGVRTGRPTLYRPELCELARRLALLGLTETEMAEAFNIDVGTLIEWKARHKEFREAIERGGVHADAHMADSLYHRGLGYRHEAVKIFMPAGADAPVYAPYTEHYPPTLRRPRCGSATGSLPNGAIGRRSTTPGRSISASRR